MCNSVNSGVAVLCCHGKGTVVLILPHLSDWVLHLCAHIYYQILHVIMLVDLPFKMKCLYIVVACKD